MATPSLSRALALDQGEQAPRHPQLAEDRDHGDRVGGGDQGAEDQRRGQGGADGEVHRGAHQDGGDRQGDGREHQDRPEVPDEGTDRGAEHRREDQHTPTQRRSPNTDRARAGR